MPPISHKELFRALRQERAPPCLDGLQPTPCRSPTVPNSQGPVAVPLDHEPAPSFQPTGGALTSTQCAHDDITRETALTTRKVSCRGRPSLRILEDPLGMWAAGNGATVWDCALLLHEFLQHEPGLSDVNALELGAGTGLVGLGLAKLGARVTLTERALAMPLLRRNAAENPLQGPGSGSVRVEELVWGAANLPSWAALPFDVVVGSDLVFPNNAECHHLLVETLCAVVGPSTRCWLAYETREQATDDRFFGFLSEHFNLRAMPAERLPELGGATTGLRILHLTMAGSPQSPAAAGRSASLDRPRRTCAAQED